MKPRATVYIDGYNWYHAIFKHHPEWKWLNIQKFFQTLRPHEDVTSIKFFTAIVDEDKSVSTAKDRHQNYVRALRTLPTVKVILGKFQNREVTCRVEGCRKKYIVPDEKKTDVNIAIEILSDAIDDSADTFVVVSGDSDVQPPVQWVNKRYTSKKIHVYIPSLPNEQDGRRLDYYNGFRNRGITCGFLPLDGIPQSQFPEQIRAANGDFIHRPFSWKPFTSASNHQEGSINGFGAST